MRAPSTLLASILVLPLFCLAQSAADHSSPKAAKAEAAIVGTAEIVFYNGVIYTGEGMGQDQPQTVQAMAVGGGKVLAVGTNQEVLWLAGPLTLRRDLDTAHSGIHVFAGFNDAHTHLGNAGQTRLHVDLTGVQSLDGMLAKIEKFAARTPEGHWLTGGSWDQTLWMQAELPTRRELDRVSKGRPAFLVRIDGHIALANSAALKLAGITGKTAVPQGGAIDLDSAGEPTGILRESAQELVNKVIPPPGRTERRRGAELAIADALAHGVTSVQDFSDWDDFLTYEELEKEGRLHLRISEWLPFAAPLPELIKMRAHHDPNDPLLHTGMLKGFMDGSLGSHTAAMKAPYADDPGNTGLPQYKQQELDEMALARERVRGGFQLGFHAIGDKAAAMALEAFEQQGNHCPDVRTEDATEICHEAIAIGGRFRIEHAQVVDPADIPRFAKLGVIASMQPNHLLTDMNWAEDRLGPKRAAYSYAWRAFLDAGVPLAFGTDYPVEPITPFRGLYAAVTRKNEAGTKEFFPANKLTRGEALAAYTQGSAYAEFAEQRKGKLLPGYEADFILVDRDLYSVDAPAILQTRVLQTFVGGVGAFAAATGGAR